MKVPALLANGGATFNGRVVAVDGQFRASCNAARLDEGFQIREEQEEIRLFPMRLKAAAWIDAEAASYISSFRDPVWLGSGSIGVKYYSFHTGVICSLFYMPQTRPHSGFRHVASARPHGFALAVHSDRFASVRT